jgi:hypothetical protein
MNMVGQVSNNSQHAVPLPPRNDQPDNVRRKPQDDSQSNDQVAASSSQNSGSGQGSQGRGNIVNITV